MSPPSAAARAKQNVKRARAELYRQLIIDAAEAEFAARGYEAAKVQDIAARAGISVGTIYGSFSGKADLYRAVHQTRTESMLGRAAAAVAFGGSPLDVIGRGLAILVELFGEHPDYLRMHLQEGTPWSNPRHATDVQADSWRAGLDLVAAQLRQGIADGTVVDDDPELLARTLMAVVQARLAAWANANMEPTAAEVTRWLADFVRRSLCTAAGRRAWKGAP